MDSKQPFSAIPHDESLLDLPGVNVYDASALEKGVVQKINQVIEEKELHEIEKKVEELQKEVRNYKSLIACNEKERLRISNNNFSEVAFRKLKTIHSQNDKYQQKLKICQNKLIRAQFNLKVKQHKTDEETTQLSSEIPEEIVPVSRVPKYDAEAVAAAKTLKERQELIKRGLATPFAFQSTKQKDQTSKTLKLDDTFGSFLQTSDESSSSKSQKTAEERKRLSPTIEKQPPAKLIKTSTETDSDYKPSLSSCSSEYEVEDEIPEEKVSHKLKFGRQRVVIDDANPKSFKRRLDNYKRQLLLDQAAGVVPPNDKVFDGGLKVPGVIWKKLYKYQKTGVKWLWELHSQQTGGILGDEMGLGKTIQVIAFLAALSKSKIRDRDASYSYDGLGPVLIVCPATVMHQWVREFHTWAPFLRIAILHSSGTHRGSQRDLISNIVLSRGILVTSYERVRMAIDTLLGRGWHYVILDEGHKIRNPEAGITHAVKLFPTPHRLILSGSPIQNHLRELWSLFDFVYPGKLGTLPVFMEQFSIPIVQGGYANASEVEVQTAYKCACTLRSTISPYLLRRMKQDVQSHIKLPEKSDQVLFCSLTDHQVEIYQSYLNSDSVYSILSGRLKVFVGLIQLRKISNHPDLFTGGPKVLVHEANPKHGDERRYGFWKRSGKMIVVESLLRIWKKQNKKVLLFTQSKQMLNILEDFVKSQSYTYLTLHGGSSISSRQPLIKRFNEDPDIFVFILTTRVGGLGVNLIGADRVIIYDPDWNPSTDAQAQERAWRIGQDKQVTIYRLLTTGTIEEKIYHRQIFKHFVSNRILKDPRQRRFFKANDMHELFTLGFQEQDPSKKRTETAAIFAGTGSEIKIKPTSKASKIATKQSKSKTVRRKDRITENLHKPTTSKSSAPSESNVNVPLLQYNEEITTALLVANTTDSPSSSIISTSQEQPSTSDKSSSKINEDKVDGDKGFSEIYNDLSLTVNGSVKSFTKVHKDSIASDDSGLAAHYNSTPAKEDKLKASFLQVMKKFQQSKTEECRKKTKKSKRHKSSVDGESVENVVKKSKFKGMSSSENEKMKSDDYVLSKLFSKGVHSAMKHTTIMESSVADYALVEAEANRVAKEAVRNIRLSRQRYKYPEQQSAKKKPRFGQASAKISVISSPTKTENVSSGPNASSFGKAGTPSSSSDLLLQIRKRNHIETFVDESEDSVDYIEDDLGEDGKLLQSLVDFIASQDKGQATTESIMNEFKDDVPPEQAPKFRAMLHKICTQTKSETGKTCWVLSDEFR